MQHYYIFRLILCKTQLYSTVVSIMYGIPLVYWDFYHRNYIVPLEIITFTQ